MKISTERKTKGLTAFSKSLTPIAKSLLGPKGFVEIDILTDWEKIVGKDLADFCLPQKIDFKKNGKDNGILHISVLSGAFAAEIKHKENFILDKINTYFGYNAVSGLKISQTHNPPPKNAAVKVEKTLVSAEEENYITNLGSGLENDSLKAALIRLGKNIFSNSKGKKTT